MQHQAHQTEQRQGRGSSKIVASLIAVDSGLFNAASSCINISTWSGAGYVGNMGSGARVAAEFCVEQVIANLQTCSAGVLNCAV